MAKKPKKTASEPLPDVQTEGDVLVAPEPQSDKEGTGKATEAMLMSEIKTQIKIPLTKETALNDIGEDPEDLIRAIANILPPEHTCIFFEDGLQIEYRFKILRFELKPDRGDLTDKAWTLTLSPDTKRAFTVQVHKISDIIHHIKNHYS
jgi:hypothetical protein